MTTLLPPAKAQFFDANGAPLAGGSVTMYIPGTTTFKTTWQDSGQVTANTNPIILDSAGEAVIFGSGSYRQVITDALGNLIWDQLTSSTDATGIALGGALRGYLSGLTLSNNSNTALNVSAGVCTDDTNSFLIGLIAGTIDCTIVGKNGLDAGALANSTWYHVFAIAQPAGFTPAFLASTSLNPTMPATYTLKRRLGSFRTDGSAHILGFTQDGDYFRWKASVADVSAINPGTAAVLRTLTVPTGVNVFALFNAKIVGEAAAAGGATYFSDPAATDETPGPGAAPFANSGQVAGGSTFFTGMSIRTNLVAQIRTRAVDSSTNSGLGIATLGWTDSRARLA